MPSIDFHAHAFPDELAPRAISRIEGLSGITSVLGGNLGPLVASMDAAGIERSVVLSIATRPSQFSSILAWSRKIASERIVPFLSVSPTDPLARENVRVAAEEGFQGLKFHPYYQDFDLDDEAMDPVYAAMEERGLICVSHTGFDHAYPFVRRANCLSVTPLSSCTASFARDRRCNSGWVSMRVPHEAGILRGPTGQ